MKLNEKEIAKDALSTKYETSFDRDVTLEEALAFIQETAPELLAGEQAIFRVMEADLQEIEEELNQSGNRDHLSDGDFLSRMKEALFEARKAAENGDLLGIFYEARRLGRLEAELVIRRRSLRHTDMGKRQLTASEMGRAMRSRMSFKTNHGAQAQRRAHELHSENPNRTWARIQEIIAKEYGVSAETIKKALINPKKEG